MKAKLIKHKFGYNLVDTNGEFIATSKDEYSNGINLKYWLSKENCDEIFGVVDVEKLAEDFAKNYSIYPTAQDDTEYGFKNGFNKAMEFNKEKLFTEDDVNLAFVLGKNNDESRINKLINSRLQPTEIEVEIEMECKIGCDNFIFNGDKSICCGNKIKKLDSNGNLILIKL
jgi:hypothetical protein